MFTSTPFRRSLIQVLPLTAGFIVLVAISVASIIYVGRAREANAMVVRSVEVEKQISAVLLDVRHAESAARGYLLSTYERFLNQHELAATNLQDNLAKLRELSADNPVQLHNAEELSTAVRDHLAYLSKLIDFAKSNNQAEGIALLRAPESGQTILRISDISNMMRREEDRLFAARTIAADRLQEITSLVTIAGSGLVVALAAFSIFMLRRSAQARDEAEAQLRDNNLNLEETVAERTADLREANEEIQRFAYIVSHDLRSPLVNIMGFTSELEELRNDIFRRIAALSRAASPAPPTAENASDDAEPALSPEDASLSKDFGEALDFIKSSISKMDRLISAILQLTREGRREFRPVQVDVGELIEGIVATVAHQASEANATITVRPLPAIVSDRLALEQIFSNLIDNALKYLKSDVPGEIVISARTKLGFVIFEVTDNGRGIDPKDHQRIFELFRRAGPQDRPGQGIGLAHVRALVRRLGGTMSVSSELNAGSTFTVMLPAKWTMRSQDKSS